MEPQRSDIDQYAKVSFGRLNLEFFKKGCNDIMKIQQSEKLAEGNMLEIKNVLVNFLTVMF
jgi:hypothetical protein